MSAKEEGILSNDLILPYVLVCVYIDLYLCVFLSLFTSYCLCVYKLNFHWCVKTLSKQWAFHIILIKSGIICESSFHSPLFTSNAFNWHLWDIFLTTQLNVSYDVFVCQITYCCHDMTTNVFWACFVSELQPPDAIFSLLIMYHFSMHLFDLLCFCLYQNCACWTRTNDLIVRSQIEFCNYEPEALQTELSRVMK